MSSPRVIVLVSNDLEFDQRVSKVCDLLCTLGYEVMLVGRKLPDSGPLTRPYTTKRLRLLFTTGPLFYIVLNIRFFFFLLMNRADVILANDLDTLWPAFMISRIRRCELVYDSHEYFTGAEGLTHAPLKRKIWERLESSIFPKLKHVVTVNESIASIYREKYGVDVRVVRNIPMAAALPPRLSRSELGIPADTFVVLLQGAYIDPDRGGMEAVLAMKELPEVHLLIIGSGRDLPAMKEAAREHSLADRITFLPRMPREQLSQYTMAADLGLSLDKPTHENYRLSLPNKLFDYIHAELPVVVSDLPELRRIVDEWQIGLVAREVTPSIVAETIRRAMNHPDRDQWRKQLALAKQALTWEHESEAFRKIFSELRFRKTV